MPVKDGVNRGLKVRPSESRPIRRRIRARKVSVKPKKKIEVDPNRGLPLHLKIEELIGEK